MSFNDVHAQVAPHDDSDCDLCKTGFLRNCCNLGRMPSLMTLWPIQAFAELKCRWLVRIHWLWTESHVLLISNKLIIIIIIISKTMFMVLSSWQSHCESSPGSFDECRMAPSGCRPKTKPDDLGCESACTGCQNLHPTSPFIIILSPKADTHFTVPRRVEGWVDLAGWLHTEMFYPPTEVNGSKQHHNSLMYLPSISAC